MKNMALIDNNKPVLTKIGQEEEARPSWKYVFPLFVLLVATTIQYQPRGDITTQSDLAFMNNPTQLIIKGSVYLLSLILVLGRISEAVKLLFWGGAIIPILLCYILFSSLWSDVPAKVYITWGHYAGVCLVSLAASFYFESNARRFLQFIAYTLSITILASIFASLIFNHGIDPSTGRWAGVTGNSNTLGGFIVIFLWSIITLLYIDRIRLIYLFLLGAGLLTLWGAGSTTSFLVNLYLVLGLVALMKLGEKSSLVRTQRYLLVGFTAVFVFLGVYFYFPELFQLEYATSIVGKDATFTGRTGVWQEAWTLISEKPFFGWSFDAATSAMKHIKYAPGQFLNGYLDLLVRGGSIGFVLFIVFLSVLLAGLKKMMKTEYMVAISSLVFIGAILIHNISESSIVRSGASYWLFFNVLYFFVIQHQQNIQNIKCKLHE